MLSTHYTLYVIDYTFEEMALFMSYLSHLRHIGGKSSTRFTHKEARSIPLSVKRLELG